MRTTLDLDEDALLAVKQVASSTGVTAGEAASALIRRALTHNRPLQERNGLLLFPDPPAGVVVSAELVDRLHDELP